MSLTDSWHSRPWVKIGTMGIEQFTEYRWLKLSYYIVFLCTYFEYLMCQNQFSPVSALILYMFSGPVEFMSKCWCSVSIINAHCGHELQIYRRAFHGVWRGHSHREFTVLTPKLSRIFLFSLSNLFWLFKDSMTTHSVKLVQKIPWWFKSFRKSASLQLDHFL